MLIERFAMLLQLSILYLFIYIGTTTTTTIRSYEIIPY